MTARENKEFSQGGGGGNGGFGDINISMNGVIIREEADIRKIADQLVSGILQKRGVS